MDENQTDQQAESSEDQTVDAGNQTEEQGLLDGGEVEAKDQTNDESTDADGDGDQSTDVPDDYEYALPDGMELDKNLVAMANPKLKELGLSQQQAQGVAEVHAEFMRTQTDQFNQQIKGWQEESRSGELFGGDDYEQNIAGAIRGFDAFFDPSLRPLLDSTGLSSNPLFLDGLRKAGLQSQEDSPGQGKAADRVKTRSERMYNGNN